MKQYIDKDALLAEIRKIIRKLNEKCGEAIDIESILAIELCKNVCTLILNIIDTLEVKEVDLENDIKNIFKAVYELGIQKVHKGE